MKTPAEKIASIDQYIQGFPEAVQAILQELRSAISLAAPEAIEKISYQMPTLYFKGNLVHFAAFERHIGLYPTPSGIAPFQHELRIYKTSKGAIQFPIDRPLPLKLIKKIVAFRVQENSRKKDRKMKVELA
ncbi:MAG: DUF1801 domain-containing protein [Rhodoferax sp.]|uniref:iron chaperone n=1 Tax=Rhodoferax sp. TaxID=50421 RepID=UPI002625EEA9|nr:DUF1801 domain-containing protein [Rhodoferax sp.]MDD5334705.1 DUF1801 domain-containing protein [Rhodoferax sp.]